VDYYDQTGRVRFNTLKGFFLVQLKDLKYITANGNYSDIFLLDGSTRLVTYTLGNIEKMLTSHGFMRIGRSLMINLNCFLEVDRQKGICILQGEGPNVSLSISSKYVKELSDYYN
jgi:two-component system LytT family response regulator